VKLFDTPAPYGVTRTRAAGLDFGGDDLGSVTDATPEENAKARRAVAARAVDVDDARLLLETLGLIAPAAPRRRPRKGVPA